MRYGLSLETRIIIHPVKGTGIQDRQGLAVTVASHQSAFEVFEVIVLLPVPCSSEGVFHFWLKLH